MARRIAHDSQRGGFVIQDDDGDSILDYTPRRGFWARPTTSGPLTDEEKLALALHLLGSVIPAPVQPKRRRRG